MEEKEKFYTLIDVKQHENSPEAIVKTYHYTKLSTALKHRNRILRVREAVNIKVSPKHTKKPILLKEEYVFSKFNENNYNCSLTIEKKVVEHCV